MAQVFTLSTSRSMFPFAFVVHTHRFSAPVCTKIKANDINHLISTWAIFYYVYLTSKVNKKKFDLFPLWYSNPFQNGIFSKMEPMLSRGVETTLLIKMSLFIMQIKVVSIEKVEKNVGLRSKFLRFEAQESENRPCVHYKWFTLYKFSLLGAVRK